MKVLVTGGAGFIGSAFVRLAAEAGYELVVCDKLTYAGDLARIQERSKSCRFYQVDIADPSALSALFEKEMPEGVVHFAAETHVDRSILNPDEFVTTNVIGTSLLLRLAHTHNVKKFIHISTDEVYGDLPDDKNLLFRETDPLVPNSPYAASKASGDLFVRAFQRTYGFPVVIVRPSNNFGPWQYPEKLIPLTIAKALRGEKIPVYGAGQNIRTWLFVEDCAQGVLQILDKGAPGEVYNIGSNEEKVNIEVIKTILSLLNKDEGLIEFVPDRPGHDFRYAVDTAKIEKEIGWKRAVPFEAGIQKTVEWYLSHTEWLFRKKAEAEEFVALLRAHYAKGTAHA